MNSWTRTQNGWLLLHENTVRKQIHEHTLKFEKNKSNKRLNLIKNLKVCTKNDIQWVVYHYRNEISLKEFNMNPKGVH